jgi:hypothetical protein
MKLITILLGPIVVVGMASTILARDYKDLVAEGYRWVSIDGPYACPLKEDLRRINRDASDINELHMVEQLRAFSLIQGALVKVIQEDGSAGMTQIRAAGITSDLWTYNKFLSRLPIKDAYAEIETPETSGLVTAETSAPSKLGGRVRSIILVHDGPNANEINCVNPEKTVNTHAIGEIL